MNVQTVASVVVEGSDARIEFVDDYGFRLQQGDVLLDSERWTVSDVRNSPSRALTEAGRGFSVGCVVVVALPEMDGERRALVMLDPVPRRDIPKLQELAVGHADMLATALALECRLNEAEHSSLTDELTGVGNRRAWGEMLEREEARCARHDLDGAVAIIGLHGLGATKDATRHFVGDEQLLRGARSLLDSLRVSDFVARLGGDKFGVVLTHTSGISAKQVVEVLDKRLEHRDVDAVVGAATRKGCGTLQAAWEAADRAMSEASPSGGR
ncbi:MAG: GGDEF domain-containing protein [Actinomycetia bacterium]|nr:GGDEF domain-containing protein [Actinomycetes bacterium]